MGPRKNWIDRNERYNQRIPYGSDDRYNWNNPQILPRFTVAQPFHCALAAWPTLATVRLESRDWVN